MMLMTVMIGAISTEADYRVYGRTDDPFPGLFKYLSHLDIVDTVNEEGQFIFDLANDAASQQRWEPVAYNTLRNCYATRPRRNLQ